MEKTNLPLAAEQLLQRISAGLWSLAAARVEICLAAELAAIHSDLMEQSGKLRGLETEQASALAARMEAVAERVTREWTAEDAPSRSRRPATALGRQLSNGAAGSSTEPPDSKRARGRPRKSATVEMLGDDRQPSTSPAGGLKEEPAS
jgi:hypothetical protein